jgi:hypothetical protein
MAHPRRPHADRLLARAPLSHSATHHRAQPARARRRRAAALHRLGIAGASLRWVLGIGPTEITKAQHLTGWLLTTIPWGTFMYFTTLGCVHAFGYFVEADNVSRRPPASRRRSPKRGWARSGCSCIRIFSSTA